MLYKAHFYKPYLLKFLIKSLVGEFPLIFVLKQWSILLISSPFSLRSLNLPQFFPLSKFYPFSEEEKINQDKFHCFLQGAL